MSVANPFARLEAISRGEASVCITCAFVCCAGRVAGEHGPCLPSCESHQVTFGPTASQPVMGERVPKLVRVEIWQADRAAALLDHLVHAARGQSALWT